MTKTSSGPSIFNEYAGWSLTGTIIIFISYIGSLLMAGGYLAIGSFISATTRNQVIAFVISALVCFLFTISGLPMVLNFFQGWLPGPVLNAIAGFSFLTTAVFVKD